MHTCAPTCAYSRVRLRKLLCDRAEPCALTCAQKLAHIFARSWAHTASRETDGNRVGAAPSCTHLRPQACAYTRARLRAYLREES
eukprot:6174869-Pleurochrysis_carterae.AAC.1